MLGRQAKTLAPEALVRALAHVRIEKYANRNAVILLLSMRAGLRACEIAGLRWSMVVDGRGRIGPTLEVRSAIAKGQSGRRVPLHRELKVALARLRREIPAAWREGDEPVVRSAKGGGAMRANSIVNWFVALYAELGLEGCSSHSGRRTFITQAARSAHRAGASLRDVQMLAGHRSIETTQGYIDGDGLAQRRLVALL